MRKVSKRNTNIELLRIASMLMIIAHHYIFYGVMQNYNAIVAYEIYTNGSTINRLLAQLLLPGGPVGVGIFFIVMGYFGVQSNRVRLVKIVKTVWTYSILGLLIYLALGGIDIISLSDVKIKILTGLFPIANAEFWFASVYIIIMLMKPVINEVVDNICSNRKTVIFIISIVGIYCICRYSNSDYLGIINGLVFYFIGAFIKKHERNFKHRYSYLLGAIISWLGYVVFSNLGIIGVHGLVLSLGSIIAICVFGTISATFFFVFTMRGRIITNKVVNRMAESVFSVYLIHENPFLREFLWSKVLKVESVQYQSNLFPIYAFVSVIVVFICCLLIDDIKRKTIDCVINRIILTT